MRATTTKLRARASVCLGAMCIGAGALLAQDSSSPSPSAPPVSTTVPAPTAPIRNVRITFLPPPLEGKISLAIYNEWDQLVRVLHQEAELDEFVIGDDALSTKWDGKDDDGQSLPPGKYQARGFTIGNLKAEAINSSTSAPPDLSGAHSISVKLMANPLAKGERAFVELSVGYDDENSFLRTADGLPVFTVAKKPNIQRAAAAKAGEKSIDIWEDDGTSVEGIHVSNVDQMMAFDCGDFELK